MSNWAQNTHILKRVHIEEPLMLRTGITDNGRTNNDFSHKSNFGIGNNLFLPKL